jgi:hypothetical protein
MSPRENPRFSPLERWENTLKNEARSGSMQANRSSFFNQGHGKNGRHKPRLRPEPYSARNATTLNGGKVISAE